MDSIYILLNIVVLLALIGLLIWMQKKHFSFTKRVLIKHAPTISFGRTENSIDTVLAMVYTTKTTRHFDLSTMVCL